MSADSSPDVRFEIGHVLFIDIVGYSKLLIHEQSEQLQTLKKSSAERSNSVWRRRKASCCVCRRAMVERSFFGILQKRQFCARWKLAKR